MKATPAPVPGASVATIVDIVTGTQKQRRGSLVWIVVSLAFVWPLFFYWWGLVLARERALVMAQLVLGITLCILVFLVLTHLWIWHNTRLAKHGSRVAELVLVPPPYDEDALGRDVSMPWEALEDVAVLSVDSTEDTKTFSSELSEV